jgi:predicted NBD/HSP70 family sugar kinase
VDGSLRSLRELNRRRVVEELLARGVASRAEIARRTGLSRSTVSSLVNDLLETGLVSERVDAALSGLPSQPGRPPVLIALDHSAGAAVGIDFGHSHLAVAVSDLAHSVLAEDWREMDVDHEAREGLDAAAGMVEEVLGGAGVDRSRVLGVGMGLPGPISNVTGTVGSTAILPGWVGVDAAAEMSERLGLPVQVDNDANLGALGEVVWGAGRGADEVAYIKAASGIGAGLVIGARLHHGATGTAGEIGHTAVREGGAICRCGNRGCLETLVSTTVIVQSLSSGRAEPLSIEQVIELAAAGDAPAQRVIGEAGRQIGVAVANLCNVFNPRRVIVGGDLSAAGELLLEPLNESVRRYAVPGAEVDVVCGELGRRAELMGALALVLRESEHPLASRLPAAAAAR